MLFTLLLAPAWAEKAPEKEAGKGAEKEKEDAIHDELRALMKELVAAYNAGDVDKLLAVLDDNVIVTWQNAAVNTNKEEVKAYIEKMTKGPNHIVDKSTIAPEADGPSLLYNDDKTAVAYGHSKDHYKLTDGTEFDQNTRWTVTLVKKDGKWKATSVHISANMFDNPILNMAVQKTTMWAGGAGVLIGLLLGLLIGVFFRRTRKA